MTFPKDNIIYAPPPAGWNFKDLTGRVYSRLTVLGYAGKHPANGRTVFWCECSCGGVLRVQANNLQSGNSPSCGCVRAANIRTLNVTHRMSYTAEHQTWDRMKTRCYNPNTPNYSQYGGRGIKLCDGWVHSFETFYADMGARPSRHHSIDRLDNNGHYSCGHCVECIANEWTANCHWATRVVQNNNTRKNVFITYQQKTQTIAQWARELGVRYQFLQQRLKAGWGVKDAFTLPPQKSRFWRR